MIKFDNPNNNEFIKHIERETNMAILELKDSQPYIEYAQMLVSLINKGYTEEQLKQLSVKFHSFFNSKVFVPLNISTGEFRFTRYGLSTNTRVESVKMDLNGIYYEDAYKLTNKFFIDPYTGKQIREIDYFQYKKEYNGDKNRCYINSGGIITNIYFDKAYLHQKTIDNKRFIPTSPIKLNNIVVYKDNIYINVIDINQQAFISLRKFYNLNFQEDNNKDLSKFCVKFNIKKDVIFG